MSGTVRSSIALTLESDTGTAALEEAPASITEGSITSDHCSINGRTPKDQQDEGTMGSGFICITFKL